MTAGSGSRRLRILVGLGLVVLAVALVSLWLSDDEQPPQPAEPTAAAPDPTDSSPTPPPPEETEAASEASEPLEVITATPEPLPTPDPRTVEALGGSSSVEDPPGDVRDAAGEVPPDVIDAAYLLGVDLASDGEVLEITWRLAGDVPEGADSLLWSVDLWSGGDLAATVTVQMVGPRVVAGALDWSSGEQLALPEQPRVEAASVALTVPLGALPALEPPLLWEALGQQDGGWEDRAPDEGPIPFGG